VQHTNKGMNDT